MTLRQLPLIRGFTLIEILLAIGILAILATATILAINPARQFAEARNAQRWNDIHAIMNAVYQYSVAHKGKLPVEIPIDGSMIEICQTDAPSCPNLLTLSSLTENSAFLTSIPIDPSCPDICTENGTAYFLSLESNGRVKLFAPGGEEGEVIELVQ